MRKRTGLRNRNRTGRSTYSVQNKGRSADKYGAYQQGRQTGQDTIAGRTLQLHKPKAVEK